MSGFVDHFYRIKVEGMLIKYFLWGSAFGLTPIALGYGLSPQDSLSWLFDLNIDSVNGKHIFRAIMGLYLALATFWVIGGYKAHLRTPALYSLVVFMFGLAGGRVISWVIDGTPDALLVIYLVLEVVFGFAGLSLLSLKDTDETEA